MDLKARPHRLMLIADSPKTTDWISSFASVSSVLVTLSIAVFITYYASGFRVRVRGWIDKGDVVRVRAFNWGRLTGEISECRIVVRYALAGRVIRGLARKPKSEGWIAPVLQTPAHLEPGTTNTWYIRLNLDMDYPLPAQRRPLSSLVSRRAERRELRLAVLVGLNRRTKYRRLRGLSGRFASLPASLAGSERSWSRRAQAERSLELVTSLTELQRDGVITEAELTTQRRSILDHLIDELRQRGLDRNAETASRDDSVDLIDVLQLLGRSRRDGLLPDSEFQGYKVALLTLLQGPPPSAAPRQATEDTSQ